MNLFVLYNVAPDFQVETFSITQNMKSTETIRMKFIPVPVLYFDDQHYQVNFLILVFRLLVYWLVNDDL